MAAVAGAPVKSVPRFLGFPPVSGLAPPCCSRGQQLQSIGSNRVRLFGDKAAPQLGLKHASSILLYMHALR